MNFISAQTKTIASNTISQVVVRFFSSFSTLLITLLISYFLGTEFFGSFVKVTTFVSFFYLIADFGINGIFIKDNKESDFGNFLILRFLISVFLIFITVIITYILPYDSNKKTGFLLIEKIGIIIYSLTIVTQGISNTFNAFFQKNKQYNKLIIPSMFSSSLLLFLVLIGIYYKSFSLILVSYFLSGLFFIFLIYKIFAQSSEIKIDVNKFNHFAKIILYSSFPLALMLFFNLIYAKADMLILSFFKPTSDVGTYGLSYRFFEFAIAIPVFLSNSIYPILLEKRNNKIIFFKMIKQYSIKIFYVSILFSILLFIGSPILGIIKKSFSPSILPLQILSVSLPFFFLTSIFQWVLIIENKKKFLVYLYIFSMVINIFLNIIFIPYYSYIASSVITVVSEAFVLLSMILYLQLLQKKIIRI